MSTQPPVVSNKKLGHIALNVRDLDRLQAFFVLKTPLRSNIHHLEEVS